MKKGGGYKKKRRGKALKKRVYVWLFAITILLFITNLFLLDTLIGIKYNRHFLPTPIYRPFFSIFTKKPPEKTIASYKTPHKVSIPEPRITPPIYPPFEGHKKPRLAIVIDDLGYNTDMADELLKIDYPITVSILPNLPYSDIISKNAGQKGKEVILHLPMEPYDYPNISVEKGTLLTTMEDHEIQSIIKRAINSLQNPVGVNNHMGSKMVENEEKMAIVLNEIKRHGLFFLDSRTSPRSRVIDIAKRINIRTAERDIFLDGKADLEYIQKQLKKSEKVARENGYAIAIGHLNPLTILALKTYLPKLQERGIRLVNLSDVVK